MKYRYAIWNNPYGLWNISHRSIRNKIRLSTFAKQIFHTRSVFHIAEQYFTRRRRISLKKTITKAIVFFWWEMVDTLRSPLCRIFRTFCDKVFVLETSQSAKPIAVLRLLRLNHLRRFSSHLSYIPQTKTHPIRVCLVWWEMVDSNHRRRSQQIYSLSPLATREISHIKFFYADSNITLQIRLRTHLKVELVDGRKLLKKFSVLGDR